MGWTKRKEKAGEEEADEDNRNKKSRSTASPTTLGEDLVYEILRHADARTLARAACVSRQWRRTAEDERLWEGICTKNSISLSCGVLQLRSVVLALGGFRRLHSLYLLPLLPHPSKHSSSSSSSLLPIMPFSSPPPPLSTTTTTTPTAAAAARSGRWGKDEVNLSLSLLSIQRFYEKMGTGNRPGGRRSSS